MKIAAIQMCSSDQVNENLKMADILITEAADKGAKVIVLPEMFAKIEDSAPHKITLKEKLGEGEVQSFLREKAKAKKVWIVGGTIPILCEASGKVKASTLVFDDEGNLVARYDKIHLFDVTLSATESYKESNVFEPGQDIVVVDTPVGKIGLAICYDIRFPELFRRLVDAGAQVLIIPAAFTVKTGEAHWELLLRSRAVENFCYVVGADQGGTHSTGRQTYGHSMIVDPWGTIIEKQVGTSTGVIVSTIDLEHLHKVRKAIPVLEHKRL